MIANFQGGEPPFQHCSDCPEAFEDGQVQPRFSSFPPTLATSIFARGSSAVRFISAPMRRGRSASPARDQRPKSRYSRNEIPPSSARYRTNPRLNLAILMLHNNDQGTSIAKARGKRQ